MARTAAAHRETTPMSACKDGLGLIFGHSEKVSTKILLFRMNHKYVACGAHTTLTVVLSDIEP